MKSAVSAPTPAPARTPVATTAPAPPPAPTPAPTPAPGLANADFSDAYFAFDSAVLTADAMASLDKDAKLLRDHPGTRIRIEGHCDERGTVEYNLALGQKRAAAARDYLVRAGVTAADVATISYGKERPFCTEHEESCWQKNRCSHVVLAEPPGV